MVDTVNVEIAAQRPTVAATLSELRYLIFQGNDAAARNALVTYYNEDASGLYVYVADGNFKRDAAQPEGSQYNPVSTLRRAFEIGAMKNPDIRLAIYPGTYAWDARSITCPVLHVHAQPFPTGYGPDGYDDVSGDRTVTLEVDNGYEYLPSYATHVNLMGYPVGGSKGDGCNLVVRWKDSDPKKQNLLYMDGGHLTATNVRFECLVRANAGCANLLGCEFAHAEVRYGGGLWLDSCTIIDPVVSGQPAIQCHTGASVYVGSSLTLATAAAVTNALFLRQLGGSVTFSPAVAARYGYASADGAAVSVDSGVLCLKDSAYTALARLGEVQIGPKARCTADDADVLSGTKYAASEISGIAYTSDAAGIIAANGTAAANATYYLARSLTLYPGKYYLAGCPSGGSTTTYRLRVARESDNAILASDYGDGRSFEISAAVSCKVYIGVVKGQTVSNLVFTPVLIRLSNKTAGLLGGFAEKSWVTGQGYLTAHQDISGKADAVSRVAMTAQDAAVQIEPNRLYIWPEMAALTITLAAPANANIANEYRFMFTSGSTATALTLPDSVHVPDGFTVDANRVYKISILEGCMTVMSWALEA